VDEPAAELRFGNLLDGVGALSMAQPLAPHWAENLSAVLGAVELISSAIASLPATIQIETPDGREPAPDTATAWRCSKGRIPARAGRV
jgi:hypothetical protein